MQLWKINLLLFTGFLLSIMMILVGALYQTNSLTNPDSDPMSSTYLMGAGSIFLIFFIFTGYVCNRKLT